MNARFLWLFIGLSAFTMAINAQNIWLPGYIITLEGDTVPGELEMRESTAQTYGCAFRVDGTHDSKTYSPNDIYGFRFNDGRFFISHSHDSLDGGKPLFFEFLVEGRVNFYHVRTTLEQSRYFAETATEFMELKETEMMIRKNDAPYLMNKKEYIGILKYMLQDAAMENEIANSSLSPRSLIKISMEYQERVCPEEDCIVYTRKMEKTRVFWSFNTGIMGSEFTFGGIANSDSRPGLVFNARAEIVDFLPFISKLSFVTGVGFRNITTHNLYPGVRNSDILYNDEKIRLIAEGTSTQPYSYAQNINLKSIFLNIPIMARYSFFSGKVQPYLSAGTISTFCVSQNDALKVHWFDNRYGKSIPWFQVGYLLNAGTRFTIPSKGNILLEASYHKTQSLDINEFYRFEQSEISFTVGYEF